VLACGIWILTLAGSARAQKQDATQKKSHQSGSNRLISDAKNALDRKDYPAAAQALEALVKSQPDSVAAWFNLAYAYTGMKKIDEAVEAYGKCLELQPDLFDAQINLGILLMEMSRAPDALEHLEKAAALKPDDARAHLYAGRALAATGKKDEATKEFLASLKI